MESRKLLILQKLIYDVLDICCIDLWVRQYYYYIIIITIIYYYHYQNYDYIINNSSKNHSLHYLWKIYEWSPY